MNAPVQIRIYDNAGQWFNGFLAPVYTRPKDFRWCMDWREHEEAMQVLSVLWRSWEATQVAADVNQDVIWLRDIMYPLMDRLTNPGGTFASCDWTISKHSESNHALNEPYEEYT